MSAQISELIFKGFIAFAVGYAVVTTLQCITMVSNWK